MLSSKGQDTGQKRKGLAPKTPLPGVMVVDNDSSSSGDESSPKVKPKKKKAKKELTRQQKAQLKKNQYQVADVEDVPERQHKPKTGTLVDMSTHPKFKKERVLRRAQMKVGQPIKGKNIHTVRAKYTDSSGLQQGVTYMGSSRPPGASGVTPHHSEHFTEALEKAYAEQQGLDMSSRQQVYDATSRENCEDCRYDYPTPAPESQVFGSEYPGNEDYMSSSDYAYAQSHHGRFPPLPKEKIQKEKAKKERAGIKKSAKMGRQHHNHLLAADLRKIHQMESDDESSHTSDDDQVLLHTELDAALPYMQQKYKNVTVMGTIEEDTDASAKPKPKPKPKKKSKKKKAKKEDSEDDFDFS